MSQSRVRDVWVPGATVDLHPERNPRNPRGYTATSTTPFVIRPLSTPPTTVTDPSTQLPTSNAQQPNDRCWILVRKCQEDYHAVKSYVDSGGCAESFLAENDITKEEFRKKKVVAEVWIVASDNLKKKMERDNPTNLTSLHLICRQIAAIPKVRGAIAQNRLTGHLLAN